MICTFTISHNSRTPTSFVPWTSTVRSPVVKTVQVVIPKHLHTCLRIRFRTEDLLFAFKTNVGMTC